ncbi:hypothetical protein JCM17960_29320 [Magnetospira thiophila]
MPPSRPRPDDPASLGRLISLFRHDLRQPLQAITLLLDVLKAESLSPRATDVVERLDRAAENLSALHIQLFDYARLQSGEFPNDLGPLDLAPLFARVHRQFEEKARRKGLTLRHVAPSAPVLGSEPLVEIILRQLLANALHVTTRGGVLFGCRKTGDHLRLQVWDSGPGLPEDQWDAIFQEGFKGDSRGLGLGLPMARQAADLLGHPLELCSQEGRGSVFSLALPLI